MLEYSKSFLEFSGLTSPKCIARFKNLLMLCHDKIFVQKNARLLTGTNLLPSLQLDAKRSNCLQNDNKKNQYFLCSCEQIDLIFEGNHFFL